MGTRRIGTVALLAATLLALTLGAAQGRASASAPAARAHASMIAPVLGGPVTQARGIGFTSPGGGTPPLLFNGGDVMRTATVYAIFWAPSGYGTPFPSGYTNLLGQYLTDVAAASGTDTNVYSIDTEYPGANGSLAYDFTYGGSWTDTGSLPTGGCTGKDGNDDTTLCLTDAQLQLEVQHAITTEGWTPGPGTMFLLFTPPAVGSCFSANPDPSQDCAYTAYCGYHSYFPSGGGDAIYANLPYLGNDYNDLFDCDTGQYPNGNTADATISVLSHELNEAITDPFLDAWYDSSGYEIGDECAWYFGASTPPGGNGSEYTQTINGHNYFMQLEWSNLSNGCLTQEGSLPAAPTVSGFAPTSGQPGTPITIDGANFTGVVGVSIGGVPASNVTFESDGAVQATVAPGTHGGTVALTTPGGTGTSVGSFTVLQSLSYAKSGGGSGTVASSPAGIDCGGAGCVALFADGTNVTLTATPTAGSTFGGWSGACTGTGTCTVTMSQARSVNATFSLPSELLTVSSSGTGSGTVTSVPAGIACSATCSMSYDYGTSVALTATPAAGSTFSGWSGACSGAGTCTVTMSQAQSADAIFAKQVFCVVPNVKGKTLASARSALASAHCSAGAVHTKSSTKVKKGRVVSQGASPGRQLAEGAKVNLVVSSGKPKKKH